MEYVVDEDQHLIGIVGLRNLITASPDTPIAAIMSDEYRSVRASVSSRIPSETHSSSVGCSARMARAARAKCARSLALGPRALTTMQ